MRSGFGAGNSCACSRQLAGGTNTGITSFDELAQPVELSRTSDMRIVLIHFLLLNLRPDGPDSLRLHGAYIALVHVHPVQAYLLGLDTVQRLRQGLQIALCCV